MEKMVLTVDEVAEVLGIARPIAYRLVKSSDFPAIRIGEGRIIVPIGEFHKWLETESKKQIKSREKNGNN